MKTTALVLTLWLTLAGVVWCEEQDLQVFDYESKNQAFQSADKLEYVTKHATQGKHAGKIRLTDHFVPNIEFYGGANHAGKWGEYDQFVIDLVVEDAPIAVAGFARDKDSKDWWTWHNFNFRFVPGKHQLRLSLGALTRQNGGPNVDPKTLTLLNMVFSSEDPKNPTTVYLDNARLVKGTGSYKVKTLYSFEGADTGKYVLEDWPEDQKGKSSLSVVEEHAVAGKRALKLESRSPAGNVQFSGFDKDWSLYDTLVIDVFNPSEKEISVGGWVRDKPLQLKDDWWVRHNWQQVLKPGFNSIYMSVGGMSGPNGGKPLNTDNILQFNLSVSMTTLFIDNIRLVKGVEEIPVAGLKPFDFGPKTSGLMPGFTRISSADTYTPESGYGWLPGAHFARDFDMNELLGRHRPPDDLCRDYLQPLKGTFVVDLPDGEYSVWLMMSCPASGWAPTFKRRTVTANGKVVLDETHDAASFKQYEFQFQDVEDLPGDDLFDRYISKLFKPTRFNVEVKGGKLTLDFDGHGQWWSAMINGLVIWPKKSDADAERWLENLNARRKTQYQTAHVERRPEAPKYTPTDDEKKRGFVLFTHSPDEEIAINSVPKAPPAAANLQLAGSPGEYVTGCVALHLLQDFGQINEASCELKGADGQLVSGRVRAVRYKALNQIQQTSVYEVKPKYLDDVSASPVAMRSGITRSFWITLAIPQNAVGEFSGTLKLKTPQRELASVPVKLTVWPIRLEEPDIPLGIYITHPTEAYHSFDPAGEEFWDAWRKVLKDSKEHGVTSLDPALSIRLQRIENGKAIVDFTAADRFMELAKAAGFKQELSGYAMDHGFPLKITKTMNYDAIAKQFGVGSYAEVVKAYFDAVREHAKEKQWLPICFCTADEYVAHPGGELAKLAAHHRLLRENALGFEFYPADSLYYHTKEENERVQYDALVADLHTYAAGQFLGREGDVMKKAGRRLWRYNMGVTRPSFGTWMFHARKKHNVSGMFTWVYPSAGTYGVHYLASHNEAAYGIAYSSSRGPRATLGWERVRLGCNDHRYLQTAWNLVEKAKKQNKAVAEADALRKAI
ncbi:MAG TPA: glycoside hydrolase domain-containing protein, partial [Planctomycetota bacterium]|nr:glycoside hydrolase domain-containing protein [Planctomycetota bacterium]